VPPPLETFTTNLRNARAASGLSLRKPPPKLPGWINHSGGRSRPGRSTRASRRTPVTEIPVWNRRCRVGSKSQDYERGAQQASIKLLDRGDLRVRAAQKRARRAALDVESVSTPVAGPI
jgi:hypothetical protein